MCFVDKRKIIIKLGKKLEETGISQRKFARLTGLRQATVNQLVNNKYERLHLEHLLVVMCFFEETDFNSILEIVECDHSDDSS